MVNRKTEEVHRIAFCGSSCLLEDAFWFDNSRVVLMGQEEGKLTLLFLDFDQKVSEYYLYPHKLPSNEMINYTEEMRYKRLLPFE